MKPQLKEQGQGFRKLQETAITEYNGGRMMEW
jgi:hypothetical protein